MKENIRISPQFNQFLQKKYLNSKVYRKLGGYYYEIQFKRIISTIGEEINEKPYLHKGKAQIS
jgi:hypothetical protein